MANPFPGMDPYLGGEMWEEFRQTFVGLLRNQLQPHCSPRYVGLLFRHSGEGTHLGIAIRERANRRLVAAIEPLSPENKAGEGMARREERRAALLRAAGHLLESDLLRDENRPAPPGSPPASYSVILTRAGQQPITMTWPFGLRDRLPTDFVPLDPPHPPVSRDTNCCSITSNHSPARLFRPTMPLGWRPNAICSVRGESDCEAGCPRPDPHHPPPGHPLAGGGGVTQAVGKPVARGSARGSLNSAAPAAPPPAPARSTRGRGRGCRRGGAGGRRGRRGAGRAAARRRGGAPGGGRCRR